MVVLAAQMALAAGSKPTCCVALLMEWVMCFRQPSRSRPYVSDILAQITDSGLRITVDY